MKGRGKKDGGVLKELPSVSEKPLCIKKATYRGQKQNGLQEKRWYYEDDEWWWRSQRNWWYGIKGTGFKGVY